MNKPTIASLSCLVANLQGQLAHAEKRLDRLEAERKARVIAHLKSNNISTHGSRLPKGYENLSGDAKAKADASMERRAALRDRQTQQQSTQH